MTKDQPEQAKKYQEQIQKFWQDFYEDALSPFKNKKIAQNRAPRKQSKKIISDVLIIVSSLLEALIKSKPTVTLYFNFFRAR
jgi:ABC-type transporter MlaC component